jgi:CBS domain-containing protein
VGGPPQERLGAGPTVPLLHLSCLVGTPVAGADRLAQGRLVDVIARLAGARSRPSWCPPVTGVVVEVAGQQRFAHDHEVARLGYLEVGLTVAPSSLGPFERRPGEVLLDRDLRSRHVIDIERARLVRASDIELAPAGEGWCVCGVDTTSRARVRRTLPVRSRRRDQPKHLLDWADIEPFVGHVPTSRLQLPLRTLRRIHPAKLADLVEAASHDEGEEIIKAVGADRELEADVFAELDTQHQLEFLRSRSDEEAARLLAEMAPDDAVDLLYELDQDRRLPVLGHMPVSVEKKVRALLDYNPQTAGGLMNPDFVAVTSTATVVEALEAVKASSAPPEASSVVFVTGEDGGLEGTVLVVDLLRARPSDSVMVAARLDPAVLTPDADVHEVVRKMSDFNLAVAPVVDRAGRLLGQVTVDDVLELLLPAGWRRQHGMASAG